MSILQFLKDIVLKKKGAGVVTTTYFASCIERRVYQLNLDLIVIADYILDVVLLTIISKEDISSELEKEYIISNQGTMEDSNVYCCKPK